MTTLATTINGFYGSQDTPAEIFIYENRNGSKWYCVEGSCMVNKTHDEIPEGANVEDISDHDCFTNNTPIDTIEQFIEAIES